MAEEIDDSGFYREDFSTESDWEDFNAQLGEIFQKWDLDNNNWGRPLMKDELFQCKWRVQIETLDLLKKSITVSYYAAVLSEHHSSDAGQEASPINKSEVHLDLISLENVFGPPFATSPNYTEHHTVARLYGLRRFVVIHPSKPSNFLINPSEFSFFLSAANAVAAEVCSTVPIFVQIYDPKWNYFLGVHVSPTMRINFNLVSLETAPASCKYLSGLLTIFKEKLPVTYVRPAVVSVRTTYALSNINFRIPIRLPFQSLKNDATDLTDAAPSTVECSFFTALPYGSFPDSCTDVYLVCTWPEIAENITIDSEMHTDFVTSMAHCITMYFVANASSYLSNCLDDFVKLSSLRKTLESFVGRNFSGIATAADVANPLDQLTKPIPLRHLRLRNKTATSQTQPKKLPGPMNEYELDQMLCYLFPDMHPDLALFPYVKQDMKKEVDASRIKSANADSLVCRLSCLLATCNSHFGGKKGLAQLWATFTRELRFLVDNCIKISGVAPGFPDTKTCLLHQKLQLLNICIARRELREGLGTEMTINPASDDDDADDVDDEFYDCDEGQQQLEAKASATALKPEGRLRRLGSQKLLHSDEPLYVPKTQDIVSKTEDQLQDDAEVMLKLGPGSDLTTQMMCTSLLSDMEAFKAANPNAVIEDFIRWYSPRDWEEEKVEAEDGETKMVGHLSARMLTPDNTWQTAWKQAKPVPAARQKRLFDDTNEALKVLHYLETRNIGEIYELTLIPLLHAAVLKLKDIFVNAKILDIFQTQLDEIFKCLSHQDPDIQFILDKISLLEQSFYQYKCVERFFKYPAKIDHATLKANFTEILQNGCLNFNGPIDFKHDLISKEYVIRVDGETTTTSKGQAGPQFLRAIITGDKLRLCGAFSENTTFV